MFNDIENDTKLSIINKSYFRFPAQVWSTVDLNIENRPNFLSKWPKLDQNLAVTNTPLCTIFVSFLWPSTPWLVITFNRAYSPNVYGFVITKDKSVKVVTVAAVWLQKIFIYFIMAVLWYFGNYYYCFVTIIVLYYDAPDWAHQSLPSLPSPPCSLELDRQMPTWAWYISLWLVEDILDGRRNAWWIGRWEWRTGASTIWIRIN